MIKKYKYKMYGLVIESTFQFLDMQEEKNEDSFVSIYYGKITKQLKDVIFKNLFFEYNNNECIIKIENIGKFYIRNGTEIIIEPSNKNKEKEIILFLLDAPIITLLHQRQFTPLHGSAIIDKITKKGIIFVGQTGVGKSTIACEFDKRGYSILTDNISSININENNQSIVNSGFSYLEIWKDVLKYYSKENIEYFKIRNRISFEKYFYKIKNFSYNSALVDSVFIIDTHNKDVFVSNQIKRSDKLIPIRNHIHKNNIFNIMDSKSCFKQCINLCNQSNVYKITRPQKNFLINELINEIQGCLNG